MKDLAGQTIGGCEIGEAIGHGGMGVIYKARQISLDRIIAMKVLAEHLAHDETFVQRFGREARAIAKINHPNILQVYDVGSEGEINYMIMELVDGSSLAETLEQRGTLPWQEANDIIRQASEGLDAAARSGIIHRDVKPDNLMMTSRGVIKVSDFGLAKEVESSMTATDAVMGTPAYMSPEQCDGKDLDVRSDIYSLGGTYYRLVTGRLPFEAETAMSMMYRHKHEPLVPAKEIVPSMPQAASDVITKMMEKKREDRPQTMAEVTSSLDAVVKNAPIIDPFKTVAFEQGPPSQRPVSGEDSARANQLRAEGDERLQRGDVVGAAKLWQEALRLSPHDPDTAARIAQSVRPEVARQKEMAEKMLAAGQIAEAARCYRNARDMDPNDEELRMRLGAIEDKLKIKRGAVNELRQLIATGHFEDAVGKWDELPPEMREESLEKQITHLQEVIIPSGKLADEGDRLNEDGRVDDALVTYQKILDIDETNAKAKQGIKVCEAKLHRIEMMIKEGYEYNVHQQYDKAVPAWEQIFRIQPGHVQAIKLIVDARFQWALQTRNKEGGLSKAVENWQRILELAPNNADAQKRFDDDSAKLSRLNQLNDELQVAKRGNKHARCIKVLKEMLRIAPTDTRLGSQLKAAKKKLGGKRVGRLLLLLLVGATVIGAAIYISEMLMLRQMIELMSTQQRTDYKRIMDLYDKGYWEPRILKHEILPLRHAAEYQYFYATAMDEPDQRKRIDLLRRAKDKATHDQGRDVDRKIAEAEYRIAFAAAEKAQAELDWKNAALHFADAAVNAKLADLRNEEIDASNRRNFTHYFALGVKYEADGNARDAEANFRKARKHMPLHPALKKKLDKYNIDPESGMELLQQGAQAIKDGNWKLAASLLTQARRLEPSLTGLTSKLQYARDNLYCSEPARNMVLVSQAEFRNSWGPPERGEAFCIDAYEFPNKPGHEPKTMSFIEAQKACMQVNKRLCNGKEWRLACAGRDDWNYPYGNAYDKKKCQTEADGATRIGDGPTCASSFGVYDMSGNLAEWVTDRGKEAPAQRLLYGGYYASDPDAATCNSYREYSPNLGGPFVGFRCCKSLSE